MERLYSKICGLPVFVTENPRPIASVADLIIDPTNGRVLAFLVDTRKGLVIAPRDVLSIKHGVVVRNYDDIIPASEILRVEDVFRDYGSFIRKKVYCESGNFIGRISDYVIGDGGTSIGGNENDAVGVLALKKIYTAKSLFGIVQYDGRIIAASSIVRVRPDRVVVKDSACGAKVASLSRETVKGAEVAFS